MKRKFALLLGVFGMVAVLFMGSGCTEAKGWPSRINGT